MGYGRVNNITYKDIHVENTDYPILLDQCYFNIPAEECSNYPSQVNITNIVFENVYGTSSGSEGDVVADLICSPNAVCEDIQLEDIDISPPNGDEGVVVCEGIAGGVGVECQASA